MARKPLLGRTQPRLFTPPLRRLTRKTSRGWEVAEFAEMIGEPFLPWQDFLVKHALELLPDGSYRFRVVIVLVARQNGKSTAKRTVSLWRMYMDGAKNILGVAQDVALAREQWSQCQETIHESPDLEAEWGGVRNVNGDEKFWLASKARYMIRAMNRKAGRGYPFEEVNIDELREQREWGAWSAVSKTIMARPNAQIWCMSNAGDDESVVLNQLREAALSGRDSSIGLFEWSAPDGCELDDRKAWAQANPALGITVSEQAIASALTTDPPNVFRTEVLCQRVDSLDAAVDLGAWRACADAAGNLEAVQDRVVACVDVAPDGDHVTLAAAANLDDGRVRTELAGAWSSTEAARKALPDLVADIGPQAIAWYPGGPAKALAPVLRNLDGVAVVEIKGETVPEACMAFSDLVTARRILQPDDPLYNAHVARTTKMPVGDGWRFARRGGVGHVDAAYAGAGATHTALTLPVEKPLPRPMIV